MAEEVLNLYQKLAKIRKMTEVIQKNKRGYNYKYTSIDEILARVTAGMEKYHVSLIPKFEQNTAVIVPNNYEKVKFTKDGRQYNEQVIETMAQAAVTYVWVNNDNPKETLEVPWYVVGSQQDPAQALGSGLTYGLRQFLTQFFQIATLDDEDPDSWRSKQQSAEETEDRLVAEKIVEQIHELVTKHLESHPEDKQKVVDLTKKYAKQKGKATANYFAIEKPAVASDLLRAMQEAFQPKAEKAEGAPPFLINHDFKEEFLWAFVMALTQQCGVWNPERPIGISRFVSPPAGRTKRPASLSRTFPASVDSLAMPTRLQRS